MQRVGEPSREMGQWRDGGWHESAQCKEGREVMLTYALSRGDGSSGVAGLVSGGGDFGHEDSFLLQKI